MPSTSNGNIGNNYKPFWFVIFWFKYKEAKYNMQGCRVQISIKNQSFLYTWQYTNYKEIEKLFHL